MKGKQTCYVKPAIVKITVGDIIVGIKCISH